MISLIGFLITILVLVTVHEFGHFAVAKALGVKVIKFSVGFGSPIIKREYKGVAYQLAYIPLGGFVQFVEDEKDKAYFHNQAAWKRLLIVLAGPAINILLAFLIFLALSTQVAHTLKPWVSLGDKQVANSQVEDNELIQKNERLLSLIEANGAGQILSVNGNLVSNWQDLHYKLLEASLSSMPIITIDIMVADSFSSYYIDRKVLSKYLDAELDVMEQLNLQVLFPKVRPIINEVVPNSPAELAGLKSDDLILSVEGNTVFYWQDFIKWVKKNPNYFAPLEVLRQGEKQVLTLQTSSKKIDHNTTIGYLGVSAKYDMEDSKFWGKQSKSFTELINLNLKKILSVIEISLKSITQKIIKEGQINQLVGPITMAKLAGDNIKFGLASYLSFLAFISLSIGIFNLLPIPLLDGGQAVMISLELLTNKKIPNFIQIVINKVGIVMIIGVMLLAFRSDFVRLFTA